MQITILGAGLVGSAIAQDLAEDSEFSVTSIDRSEEALSTLDTVSSIETIRADLSDPESLKTLIGPADLVISAVPGFMGFETLRTIIESRKNVVDIAFFPENALDLDVLARDHGVTAVVDCGVAPGLCNIIAGYIDERLDQTERYECYVGGLPHRREWPYEYKAVFSPADVLEEYTRPARFVEFGNVVTREALSDIELMNFPGVSTLEAFNTDGLRSLMFTMDIPFMKEKTLRYPGHASLMKIFREGGFFSQQPVDVGGQQVRPLDMTSRLMFNDWHLGEGETDFTVMQVILEGRRADHRIRFTYDLLDHFDAEKGVSSMARTTGYTCSLIARQVLSGMFTKKGISPPEFIGRTEGCYEELLKGYDARNISVTETITELG